jgi:hypothetical protein
VKIPGHSTPLHPGVTAQGEPVKPQTWIARLDSAPFPWQGTPEAPFFGVTGPSGEALHRATSGALYPPERYASGEVLLHASAALIAGGRPRWLVYLHGQGASLRRRVIAHSALPDQVEASGCPAALVAPQLALEALDSDPGRLDQPGAFAALLDEAAGQLRARLGAPLAALDEAPVAIAAFSGGYRAAAAALARGGLGDRIDAVLLLDALYARIDDFADWAARGGALDVVYTDSSAAGTARLEELLAGRGLRPRRLARLETPHLDVPALGPPRWPVAEWLRGLRQEDPRQEEPQTPG